VCARACQRQCPRPYLAHLLQGFSLGRLLLLFCGLRLCRGIPSLSQPWASKGTVGGLPATAMGKHRLGPHPACLPLRARLPQMDRIKPKPKPKPKHNQN